MPDQTSLLGVLSNIREERVRQDTLWGEQNHPQVPPKHLRVGLGVCSERSAKFYCESARLDNKMTWAHIAIEEMAEVVDAETEEARRAEWVQLAAVCIAAIQSIDRNKK